MKKLKMKPKPPGRLKRLENIEGKLKDIKHRTILILGCLQVMINEGHVAKLEHITALLEDAQAARDRRWLSRIKSWLRRPAKEQGEIT